MLLWVSAHIMCLSHCGMLCAGSILWHYEYENIEPFLLAKGKMLKWNHVYVMIAAPLWCAALLMKYWRLYCVLGMGNENWIPRGRQKKPLEGEETFFEKMKETFKKEEFLFYPQINKKCCALWLTHHKLYTCLFCLLT